MAVIGRASLPEQVFRELTRAVLSGDYEAGEPLPPQRALAAELGVNLASLRDGLARMEQLGLVDVRHGDATRVADWRARSGLDVLAYAAAADAQVVAAVFEARRLLLREAARLAAARRTSAQADELAAVAARMAQAAEDGEAQALDLAFFAGMIEASGNLVFTLILNSIRALYIERLELFRAIVGDRQRLVPLYAAAARAVEAGDADGAADAVDAIAVRQEELMDRALAALGPEGPRR